MLLRIIKKTGNDFEFIKTVNLKNLGIKRQFDPPVKNKTDDAKMKGNHMKGTTVCRKPKNNCVGGGKP